MNQVCLCYLPFLACLSSPQSVFYVMLSGPTCAASSVSLNLCRPSNSDALIKRGRTHVRKGRLRFTKSEMHKNPTQMSENESRARSMRQERVTAPGPAGTRLASMRSIVSWETLFFHKGEIFTHLKVLCELGNRQNAFRIGLSASLLQFSSAAEHPGGIKSADKKLYYSFSASLLQCDPQWGI